MSDEVGPLPLDFETGRTGYSVIPGFAGGAILSASYTIDPDKVVDITTCLGAMSGVSIGYSGGELDIQVTPPFDDDQLDKAIAAVTAIDPTAEEI